MSDYDSALEPSPNPILSFSHVGFSYGAHRALADIDISIDQGEFICVVGGNGSGKSTFAKHINALLVPETGSVSVFGHDTADMQAARSIRSRVGMVFQNPDDQIVASIVEDDIAFGPSNLGVVGDELERRVDRALCDVGLEGMGKQEVATLSGGQKQRVAIAGALAMEPSILVLDEPTAMLDPRGRSSLLELCRTLNASGITIVLITHIMEEAALSDRVIVLNEGRIAMSGSPGQVLGNRDQLVSLGLDVPFSVSVSLRLQKNGFEFPLCVTDKGLFDEIDKLTGTGEVRDGMIGRLREQLEDFLPSRRSNPEMSDSAEPESQPIIAYENVYFSYQNSDTSSRKRKRGKVSKASKAAVSDSNPVQRTWTLEDIALSIGKNAFFGIAGATGSGKSTLIQLSNGLLLAEKGIVRVHGESLVGKDSAQKARRKIGLVFQYPERQLFAATVFDDVAFGPRNLGYPAGEVEQRVDEALLSVGLDPILFRDRSPFKLSGGEQRRVALAGVLAMRPEVLVLDEPTAGLDPRSRRELISLLRKLNDGGMGIVYVSHAMDDLAALCDAVAILNDGHIVRWGTPAEVFGSEGSRELRSWGLDIPRLYRLDAALR